jgi:hypothetical protein
MTAVRQNFGEVGRSVSGGVSMCLHFHLFKAKAGFVEGTCRGTADKLPEYRENAPHGKAFEGWNDFHSGFLFNSLDQGEILPQPGFFDHKTGGGNIPVQVAHLSKILHFSHNFRGNGRICCYQWQAEDILNDPHLVKHYFNTGRIAIVKLKFQQFGQFEMQF